MDRNSEPYAQGSWEVRRTPALVASAVAFFFAAVFVLQRFIVASAVFIK